MKLWIQKQRHGTLGGTFLAPCLVATHRIVLRGPESTPDAAVERWPRPGAQRAPRALNQAPRGPKAMMAMPPRQTRPPTTSQVLGRTPSTAHSHSSAAVTYTPP